MTARVVGIGGVFFKARDPERLRSWYRDHLELELTDWGGVVFEGPATTVWSVFPADTQYFEPSEAGFMINYRVENLDRVLAELRSEGCQVDDRVESSELGKFGWVMDPEGNRLELWEPPPRKP